MTERGPVWTGKVRLIPELLDQPLRWKSPRRIFVNSMSDLFHEKVSDDFLDRIWAVMLLAPHHCFQILTKRPDRMLSYLKSEFRYDRVLWWAGEFRWHRSYLNYVCISNPARFPAKWIWLGVSVEDQKTADERIPLLLRTPAAVRWISYEPALGPMDFMRTCRDGRNILGWNALSGNVACDSIICNRIDWIVAGGESGPRARPAHPDWVRSIRDQCQAAGVPFFFKQWGEYLTLEEAAKRGIKIPITQALNTNSIGICNGFLRVGKKAAGHLLDGREWKEYPRGSQD